MQILSPVTNKSTTKQVASVDAQEIVRLYKKQGVDVSSYFAGLVDVQIRECQDTSYRFYYPPSTGGAVQFYDDIFAMTNELGNYREWGFDYQFAFDRLKKGDRVLDIGCGFGNFIKRAKAKAETVGLEANPKAFAHCLEHGLNVHRSYIQEFAEEHESQFDVVCTFHVLEHVYEVQSFLTAAIKCLKPGGKLVIGVPNNEPYQGRFVKYNTWNLPPHHVGLWDSKSLAALQSAFNLKIVEQKIEAPEAGGVLSDAYLRTKLWMDIRTSAHEHSWVDKAKMLIAAPIAVPLSAWDLLVKRKREGDAIVVMYEKLGLG